MATTVFLQSIAGAILASAHRGTDTAKLDGTVTGWKAGGTSTSRGTVTQSRTSATVTGATNGVEVGQNDTPGTPPEWITPPIDADVTISGAITGNIWASESNMSANVAINFKVDRIAATDGTLTQIVKSARTTEVAVTTRAVNNFTATPGAGVSCNKGDRLRITIFGDDAGTMATGFTFNVGVSGPTAAADGDTFISFTETFGFQTTDPTGSTLYLTDTASDVATAAVDREAWTSRGGGVVNDVTNTAAGWTAPIQVTDTAGGTVVDWYTKQLQAFTLSGLVKFNLRAQESNLAANASVGVEIARVDADGTNATVWSYANRDSGNDGEITGSEQAYTVYPASDDLAFTDGQRLRVRLFVDDRSDIPLVTGHTVTTYYNGTSGGASGDTFLILEQTVTEFVSDPAVTLTSLVTAPYRAS